MSSQVINRDGSQPEIGSSGSVSAADEEFHTGRSFIQELARQLRHEFETLQAEDQRRKDLDALRAEDRRQQEISQRIVATMVHAQVERISEHLDRLAGQLTVMEHPRRWQLVEELAGIERQLACLFPRRDIIRSDSGNPPSGRS